MVDHQNSLKIIQEAIEMSFTFSFTDSMKSSKFHVKLFLGPVVPHDSPSLLICAGGWRARLADNDPLTPARHFNAVFVARCCVISKRRLVSWPSHEFPSRK